MGTRPRTNGRDAGTSHSFRAVRTIDVQPPIIRSDLPWPDHRPLSHRICPRPWRHGRRLSCRGSHAAASRRAEKPPRHAYRRTALPRAPSPRGTRRIVTQSPKHLHDPSQTARIIAPPHARPAAVPSRPAPALRSPFVTAPMPVRNKSRQRLPKYQLVPRPCACAQYRRQEGTP